MEGKKGQQATTSGVSTSAGSLQLPEGPAIAFRNLKNAKVRQMVTQNEVKCGILIIVQGIAIKKN